MRRLLLVGPPGVGKSSQGARLAQHLGVSYLSTGALLREEVERGSPIGRQAAGYMRAGLLVPDWLMLFALERYMSDALASGFVLDGYPRTVEQADRFLRSLGCARLDHVIELAAPDDVLVGRLAGRAVCGRADDDESTVRARLDVYRAQTRPMLDFFAAAGLLVTVDGSRSEEDVTTELFGLVDSSAVQS